MINKITGSFDGFMFFVLFAGFLLSITYAIAAGKSNLAEIEIYPDQVLGVVNRNILGNNIIGYSEGHQASFYNRYGGGVWDPKRRVIDQSYKELIKNAGVSVLRWPGGNWVSKTDWRKLVGPHKSRPENSFGLHEFLLLCHEVTAIPLITLPVKKEYLEWIPGLVEYLNAPDDGTNPGGGVDWAAKRALDGRKEPWNVIWFEFGNEPSGEKDLSMDEYIARFLEINEKIKELDNRVKLGAVLEDSDNTGAGWTYEVITRLGEYMDFAIIHPYYPTITRSEAARYSKEEVALSTVAADAPFEYRLRKYNDVLIKETGRNDIGLAATEYNGLFVQSNPVPYRFTLVNAIHNADMVRIMLKPESNIFFANNWQLLNSYWGMIQEIGKESKVLVKQANYFTYEIYHKYLSDQMIAMNIDAPTIEFQGAARIPARIGNIVDGRWKPYTGTTPATWQLRRFSGVEQKQSGGIVGIRFNNQDVNYYHATKTFNVKPNTLYRVWVKARVKDFAGGKIGIALQDHRGWKETYNQPSSIQLIGDMPWQWVMAEIRTLPDAKKLRVMVRRIGGKGEVSGYAEFGELRIEENISNLGAIESLVGVASTSSDKSKIEMILINKNLHKAIDAKIRPVENYTPVLAETFTGPSPYSTNMPPDETDTISIKKTHLNIMRNRDVLINLPPLSVTGIRLEKIVRDKY